MAVTTAAELGLAIRIFLTQIAKAIPLDIVANLTAPPSRGGTPVDTGWARANWIPNIGRPSRLEPVGSRESVSNAAQKIGIAAVATGFVLEDREIHVSNNVPYIGALNNGSSAQAPSGFVEIAILKAVRVDIFLKIARFARRTGGGVVT